MPCRAKARPQIDQARLHAAEGRAVRLAWTASYVDALVGPLEVAHMGISGRRAVAMLRRSWPASLASRRAVQDRQMSFHSLKFKIQVGITATCLLVALCFGAMGDDFPAPPGYWENPKIFHHHRCPEGEFDRQHGSRGR